MSAPRTAAAAATPEFAGDLLRWYARHKRDLPWRRTRDPYAIWISEIMLQQTTVGAVIPYYERWLETFPDIDSLARAPLQKVLKAWQGLGYYARARNLRAAAGIIVGRARRPFSRAIGISCAACRGSVPTRRRPFSAWLSASRCRSSTPTFVGSSCG